MKVNKNVAIGIMFILIGFLVALILYYSEYANTDNIKQLTKSVKEFSKGESFVSDIEVVAATKKDNIMVAYLKGGEDVYGFAQFKKGFNNRYLLIKSGWFPNDIPIALHIIRGDDYNNDYYVIGGYNCDSIKSYGLKFYELNSNKCDAILQFNVNENNFVNIYSNEEIFSLYEKITNSNYLNQTTEVNVELLVLDDNGNDNTNSHRKENVQRTWSSGTGTEGSKILYVYMLIPIIIGLGIGYYFLNKSVY